MAPLMANPSRKKGTAWEVELLPRLRRLFGNQVERAPLKGSLDEGDFTGVPWPHEAKHTKRPLFLEWLRRLRFIAAKKGLVRPRWALIWKGDGRTVDGMPVVVIPLELYEELIGYWRSDQLLREADGDRGW